MFFHFGSKEENLGFESSQVQSILNYVQWRLVEAHKYYLGQKLGREVSFVFAFSSWKKEGLLDEFLKRFYERRLEVLKLCLKCESRCYNSKIKNFGDVRPCVYFEREIVPILGGDFFK